MKIEITGASNFVNRMFEACGSYQWAREFLKNSLEAGATKVEFGIEWQAVEKLGVYRRTVMDDGAGMDSSELRKFFSTLGEGAKKIGGVHENFGVGAKIASLPWNPEGVVVMSYKNGRGSMIWIVLDPDSGDYELAEFKTPTGKACVIEPTVVEGIDWAALKPSWITDHGTVIVLLGSESNPDTVLGNVAGGEREIKGISVYLNSRFWDLSKCDVKVVEVRSEKKTQWPLSPNDEDDARRPNNRTIFGARHYLTEMKASDGNGFAASGTVKLQDDRVNAEWYLWKGERPRIETYAKRHGYIAVRYRDELFELTSNKTFFRAFGITESQVQQNLTIVLDPQLYEAGQGRWGVHPDQSRNRLIFSGTGEKGAPIPLTEWGVDFACKMPEEIREAIRAARGEGSGTIDDEDYRKRLQDKFGTRWSVKVLVATKNTSVEQLHAVTPSDEQVDLFDHGDPTDDEKKKKQRRKRKPTLKIVEPRATPEGADQGTEKDRPVDVPRYRFAHKDDFDEPWHLAMWAPNDILGPHVLINVDSSILDEIVKHHQSQYPDVFAEEVADTVRRTFGEIAACKVAHAQQLTKLIPEERVNESYRCEEALTISLMGLLAEESVIAVRLGKLGSKKRTSA